MQNIADTTDITNTAENTKTSRAVSISMGQDRYPPHDGVNAHRERCCRKIGNRRQRQGKDDNDAEQMAIRVPHRLQGCELRELPRDLRRQGLVQNRQTNDQSHEYAESENQAGRGAV
jgi:hypothetical protein